MTLAPSQGNNFKRDPMPLSAIMRARQLNDADKQGQLRL